MQEGFIILQRKITGNWLWLSEPFSKAQAWIDLLLLANHAEGSFFVRGVKVVIKRGHVGKSEESLSQRWKWSRGKVRSFLKLLEIEQQIKQHKSPILNVIEVTNYNLYQKMDNRPNNKKTTERQQKDTNNKEEIIIKEEEINIPSFIDQDLLKKFFDFRNSMATSKKPFTDDAKELTIKKLTKFEANQKGAANQALENSIANSWQGVFEPKSSTQTFAQKPIANNGFALQINQICQKELVSKTFEDESTFTISCKSPHMAAELKSMPDEIRQKIKDLINTNKKIEVQ